MIDKLIDAAQAIDEMKSKILKYDPLMGYQITSDLFDALFGDCSYEMEVQENFSFDRKFIRIRGITFFAYIEKEGDDF